MDVGSLKKQPEQSMREGNSILYQSLVFGFFFTLSQEFLFLSKLYVLSSTSLFSVNLSLFSLKTKVWTAVTVTPLKSMDFLWCKIKFPLLFIVLVPLALFFAVHPTHDIPYWITSSFSFFHSFSLFFPLSTFRLVSLLITANATGRQLLVLSIHQQEEHFMAEPKTGQTTSPQMKS